MQKLGFGSWLVTSLSMVCACTSLAGPVDVRVSFSQPLMLAGQRNTAYLKVGMLGTGVGGPQERAPVNVALVIDRSGSMAGHKLQQAKDAAIQALYRLAPQDIVSVVAYDHNVIVLLPATRASDKQEIAAAINRLYPGGSTALFAGVARGAQEVRKFLTAGTVNRVVLLSDGLANVGPSSAEDLANLGASLRKEGISVTTIGLGLGYGEDLMVSLARASDGNHAFVENSTDLARIFGYEFGDLLSVVAKDVELRIAFSPGVRPVRVLGRDAEVVGQTVVTSLQQIYGKQEKYVLVEVELEGQAAGTRQALADIKASFVGATSGVRAEVAHRPEVSFTASAVDAERSIDREVMVAAVEQIANENNKRALSLRDRGLVDQARSALMDNEAYLKGNADRLRSERLRRAGEANKVDANNLDGENWNRQRKSMRKTQYEFDSQQAW